MQALAFRVQFRVQLSVFGVQGFGFSLFSLNPKPWVLKLVERTAGTPGYVGIRLSPKGPRTQIIGSPPKPFRFKYLGPKTLLFGSWDH